MVSLAAESPLPPFDGRREMTIHRRLFWISVCLVSLCALGATAQQVYESQLLRFRTEVVATGLKAAVGADIFARW